MSSCMYAAGGIRRSPRDRPLCKPSQQPAKETGVEGSLWLLTRTSPCCSKLPNSRQGEAVCVTVERVIATGWDVPVVAVEPHTVGDARLGVEELHVNLCIGRSYRLSSMRA